MKFFYCAIETNERYTSCIVRCDDGDLSRVRELALKQLPHDDYDDVDIRRIPNLLNRETWHLENMYY